MPVTNAGATTRWSGVGRLVGPIAFLDDRAILRPGLFTDTPSRAGGPDRGGVTMLPDLTRVPMYPDLTDKVAVVTGSSRGIGAATARLLAANGIRVAVNGRDQATIDNTLGEIRSAGGQAIGVVADCTNLAEIEHMR